MCMCAWIYIYIYILIYMTIFIYTYYYNICIYVYKNIFIHMNIYIYMYMTYMYIYMYTSRFIYMCCSQIVPWDTLRRTVPTWYARGRWSPRWHWFHSDQITIFLNGKTMENHGKSQWFMGKLTIKLPLSILLLNHQRVVSWDDEMPNAVYRNITHVPISQFRASLLV